MKAGSDNLTAIPPIISLPSSRNDTVSWRRLWQAIVTCIFLRRMCLLFFLLSVAVEIHGQQVPALRFLFAPKSAEMAAAGYASVGWKTDDIAAIMHNPAHLGMQSRHIRAAAYTNFADWLPGLKPDLWTRSDGVLYQVYESPSSDDRPQLSVGVGYAHHYMYYGEYIPGFQFGHIYDSYDGAYHLSVGAAVDYGVAIAAGITYKLISSSGYKPNLSPEKRKSGIAAGLFDAGLLLDIPAHSFLSGFQERCAETLYGVFPDGGITMGAAYGNFGPDGLEFYSIVESERWNEPYPRTMRAGVGFYFDIRYRNQSLFPVPVSFHWTNEVNDLLLTGEEQNWEYQTPPGDINFFNNVLFGKANNQCNSAKGFRITLAETVSYLAGRAEQDFQDGRPLRQTLNTSGLLISSAGMSKILRAAYRAELEEMPWLDYTLRHIELRFVQSEICPERQYSNLRGTKFESFSLYWRM